MFPVAPVTAILTGAFSKWAKDLWAAMGLKAERVLDSIFVINNRGLN